MSRERDAERDADVVQVKPRAETLTRGESAAAGSIHRRISLSRNGRPLERSARIKRHFDGATAKIEISKVKASDAGEYTCVATNVLGSTRNSCQVNGR